MFILEAVTTQPPNLCTNQPVKRVLEQASRRWHEILIHAPRQVRREQLPEADDRDGGQRKDLRVELAV